VVAYNVRRLADLGYVVIGARGHSRSIRVVRRTDPAARVVELEARELELENGLRLMRRWIESEEKPGEWTAEIYDLAGKLLPY